MPKNNLPTPSITIDKKTARRFLLAHQGLWPPRQLNGKPGVLKFIRRVNCIQYDPIQIAGTNPDLVLQSRVQDYRPTMLDELRYEDRSLVDGWDKVASIYPVEDWPFFERHRIRRRDWYLREGASAEKVIPQVRQAIQERGPLSSLDIKQNHRVDWHWGPTSAARAALEALYFSGELGVHHRVGTRRYFDLIENLIPAEILNTPDPNPKTQDYQDEHVLRRIGSLGIAHPGAGEHWLGLHGAKSPERYAALSRLVKNEKALAVSVQELANQTLFIRTEDLPLLEKIRTAPTPPAEMVFIAALDNLIWNRKLIQMLFDFSYTWEIYKPAAKREYGYYVLPVLFGDRLVGRAEPKFEQKKQKLTIHNWWWEPDITPDAAMLAAREACIANFAAYLDAQSIHRNDLES